MKFIEADTHKIVDQQPSRSGLGLRLCKCLLLVGLIAGVSFAEPAATQPADGSIVLGTAGAAFHGFQMHVQKKPEPHFVYWVDPQEYIEWPHGCARKGKFDVEITYSCAPGAGGNFIFIAGTGRLQGHAEATGGWEKWKTVKVGNITVTQDGLAAFLKADGQPQNALLNLLRIRLIPAVTK